MTKVSSEAKNTADASGNTVNNNIHIKAGTRKRTTRIKNKNQFTVFGITISGLAGFGFLIWILFKNSPPEDVFIIPDGQYEMINRPEYKGKGMKWFQSMAETYTLQPNIRIMSKKVISENPQGTIELQIFKGENGRYYMDAIDYTRKPITIPIDYSQSQNVVKFQFPRGVLAYKKK